MVNVDKLKFINNYVPKDGGTYQCKRLYERIFDGEFETSMNRLMLPDEELLNEALIASYDIFKVKDIFNRKFAGGGIVFNIVEKEKNGHTGYYAVVDVPEHLFGGRIKNEIIEFMKFCGYDRHAKEKRDNGMVSMFFTQRFQDEDCTEELRQKCRYLYHITSVENQEDIFRNGFVPSSRNMYFNYPDRVYVATGNNLNPRAERLLKAVWAAHGKKESVIIMIDLDKVPYNVKFYTDFDATESVFTCDNISPEAIAGVMPMDGAFGKR
jgi:hypothetical protein